MTIRLALPALGAALLLSSGCIVVDPSGPPRAAHRHYDSGPPPHAPAHGYRHKHRGRDLVFDTELGVYAVVGLRDVWFLDGSYFRVVGDHFEIAVGIDGPWRVASSRAVPSRLYTKRHPKGGPPGQSKKHGRR